MMLSKYEQETIINFNVAESDAVVFTRDKAVIRKLDALVTGFPEVYKCIGETDIDKTYSMPKQYVSYRKPNINKQPPDGIFVGHNYGGSTWIRAAIVNISEKIEFRDVHEVGMEVSVDKDLFDTEFKDIFLRYFDFESEVNKNRFTRAFLDCGRYLYGYESDILEPYFFTKAAIVEISDEIEKRGREQDLKLAALLKDVVRQAPEECYILVFS